MRSVNFAVVLSLFAGCRAHQIESDVGLKAVQANQLYLHLSSWTLQASFLTAQSPALPRLFPERNTLELVKTSTSPRV
jgi:hypothetical protein